MASSCEDAIFTFGSVNNLRSNNYFDGALLPLPPPDGWPVVLGQFPPPPLPPPLLPPLPPPPPLPFPPPCEPPLLIVLSFSCFVCFTDDSETLEVVGQFKTSPRQ
jgi:hypothetical protein